MHQSIQSTNKRNVPNKRQIITIQHSSIQNTSKEYKVKVALNKRYRTLDSIKYKRLLLHDLEVVSNDISECQ